MIYIDGAHSLDWEDIACGPCPGGSGHCIYIADTGGNAGGDANTIYRIREPAHIHDQHVHVESILQFRYLFGCGTIALIFTTTKNVVWASTRHNSAYSGPPKGEERIIPMFADWRTRVPFQFQAPYDIYVWTCENVLMTAVAILIIFTYTHCSLHLWNVHD